MFRAREHTHTYLYHIFFDDWAERIVRKGATLYVFDIFYWHLSFFKVEEIINPSYYIFVKGIIR